MRAPLYSRSRSHIALLSGHNDTDNHPQKTMPFFNSATNFEIQNSTFNDIAGNYTANNTTTNRTLTNSNNKRAKTVENSYNDSSMGWNTRGDGAEEMMVRSGRRAPGKSLIASVETMGAQLIYNSLVISPTDGSGECRSCSLSSFSPWHYWIYRSVAGSSSKSTPAAPR